MNDWPVLGKLIEGQALRDAVHVAVAPVIAAVDLNPGERVVLCYGTNRYARKAERHVKATGVVDPFLADPVKTGQSFYMMLYPGSVTGMRHHWRHVDFEWTSDLFSEAENWLREFARKWSFDFDTMISEALVAGIIISGHDFHSVKELGPDQELFWFHLEKLTGKKFGEDHQKHTLWSCSC